jgi:hypothetical protein
VAAGLAVIAAIPLVFVPLAHRYLVATDPVETVRAYFQALADRDADRARALLNPLTFRAASPSADQQTEQQMLSAHTLRDPGYTPPRHVQVAMAPPQQRRHNDDTVLARFDLADGHHQMLLPMYHSGAGAFGSWLISEGLASLSLPDADVGGADLLVAGNLMPATGVDLPQVFPGSYLVTLSKDPIREAVPLTLASNGGRSGRLTVRVRQDVQAAVEQQVRAYLAGCAASVEAHPAHCPIGYPSVGPVTDLHYKIITYPVLTFNISGAAGANVLGTGGRFQVTGRDALPGGQAFTGEYEFAMEGTVRAGDGKAVFQPQS